MNIFQVIEV